MRVTHNLRMDLARCSCTPVVNAVQGEGNTRALIISLYDNGAAWEAPEGTTAAVAYKKPDGLCGLYDQLPNGDTAVTIDGSAVTAILAPQALTVPGEVTASVVFYDQDMDRLATFPFRIRVAVDPAGGQHVSNEYYKYSTLEEFNEAVDAALEDVTEAVDAALAALEVDRQAFLDEAKEALALTPPAIVCDATGQVIQAGDSSDRPLHGLTLYGKTTQNGTPTPENPVELVSVGESGAINTTVAGKNLFPKASADVSTKNGVTLTSNGDGSYTVKGTATGDVTLQFPLEESVVLREGMYLHCMNNASADVSFVYWYSDFTNSYWALSPVNRISAPSKNFGKTITQIGINMESGKTVDVTFSPMFVFSDKAMDFVPYQSIQTLTASTPNGLPGIPLGATIPSFIKANDALMPGAWWDEETQQYYLSDTKDYARGVYVKRVVLTAITTCDYFEKSANIAYCNLVYYPTRGKSFNVLSEKFINDRNGFTNRVAGTVHASTINSGDWSDYMRAMFILPAGVATTRSEATAWLKEQGVAVLHPLYEPIETALPDEELTAYAELHTNKPHTTVYNDAGAGMAVEYVADTKNYIDQKLAAISAALLNA